MDKATVIDEIRTAFVGNEYPGDGYLQGTFEGCEPAEEVGPFKGQTDWAAVDAAQLDGHYNALSFFSEAGFRFFLPAYLIADLEDRLRTADPLFHLTHGFHDESVEVPTPEETFVRRIGGAVLLNPRRYGAMTFHDHARFRLSIFTREEARAIVAYLRYKRHTDEHAIDTPAIDAALDAYWLDRAANAPSAESLRRHCEEEERYLASITR
jgi:hypothetical protein